METFENIQEQVSARDGEFLIFRTGGDFTKEKDWDEQVYVLDRKYYKASRVQRETSMQYIHQGVTECVIHLTVEDSHVGPEDSLSTTTRLVR